MISQSLYFDLVDGLFWAGRESVMEWTEEMEQFRKPYVLVIHQPSGRGFYVDRQYRHIIDVKDCQEPKNFDRMEPCHLCSDLPDWAWACWAYKLIQENRREEFVSFWLLDKLTTPLGRVV